MDIAFGLMCQPLWQQLDSQGFTRISADTLEPLQQDADNISRLFIRGILSAPETKAARKRLYKRILLEVSIEMDKDEGSGLDNQGRTDHPD